MKLFTFFLVVFFLRSETSPHHLQQNALTLFCCEAPDMFRGLWNFTWLEFTFLGGLILLTRWHPRVSVWQTWWGLVLWCGSQQSDYSMFSCLLSRWERGSAQVEISQHLGSNHLISCRRQSFFYFFFFILFYFYWACVCWDRWLEDVWWTRRVCPCALEPPSSPLPCVFVLGAHTWSDRGGVKLRAAMLAAHRAAQAASPGKRSPGAFGEQVIRETSAGRGDARMWRAVDVSVCTSRSGDYISPSGATVFFVLGFFFLFVFFLNHLRLAPSNICTPRPSPAVSHSTMRAGETRSVPCWTTLRPSCWLWPRWPDFSSDAKAGATKTSSCRPSTPPTGSWPTWRWTCASPRGPWRRAKPRPTPPPCRLCPSATWASRESCPPLWWPAGTAASASSVMCSSTPPTTTEGLFSRRLSTGRSRPSSSSTSGSPGVSRSCGCAWAAGCPATAGSVRAGRGASRPGIRSRSAAWISASKSWRGTKVGGWTGSPSSRHLWLVSWLWSSSCGVLLLSYGRSRSLQDFCPMGWSRGDPDNWNHLYSN